MSNNFSFDFDDEFSDFDSPFETKEKPKSEQILSLIASLETKNRGMSPPVETRMMLLQSLASRNGATPLLMKAMQDPDFRIRRAAIDAINDPAALPALIEKLADHRETGMVQRAVLRALARLRTPETDGVISAALTKFLDSRLPRSFSDDDDLFGD